MIIVLFGLAGTLMLSNKESYLEKIGIAAIFTSESAAGQDYIRDGNDVYVNDSRVYIRSTAISNQPLITIQTKTYTGNINLGFGFNTSEVLPIKAEYNPHIEAVNEYFTCNDEFNYTVSPKYFTCFRMVNYTSNLTNETSPRTFVIKEGPFESGNLGLRTVRWSVNKTVWDDVSGAFEVKNVNYAGSDRWYIKNNFAVVANETYQLRLTLQPQSINTPSHKYNIVAYPSSKTIPQAISSDTFYLLDPWTVDTDIVTGLVDPTNGVDYTAPEVFYMNSTWYLVSGSMDQGWDGYNWTGSSWQVDTGIIAGLTTAGLFQSPTVFEKDSTWFMIYGNNAGLFYGLNWTGSTWQADSSIVSGLNDVGTYSKPEVFYMNSTFYLIAGAQELNWYGYKWTGSTWQTDAEILSGLVNTPTHTTLTTFNNGPDWYLIAKKDNANYSGYNWTGSTWQSDSNIVSGLNPTGVILATPTVFHKDSLFYLIIGSQNGTFHGHELNMLNAPTMELNEPVNYYNSSFSTVNVSVNITDIMDLDNVTLYIDGVSNWTNTSPGNGPYFSLEQSYDDGLHNWTFYACNNISRCNDLTIPRYFTVDSTSPSITLTSPVNISIITSGDTLYVNWTVTDAHLDSCWYEYANVNTSVNCSNTSDAFTWSNPYNNLMFYANDTYGNENNASISWSPLIEFIAETYENTTVETAIENFTINASCNSSSWLSSAIYFNYNGTIYTPTTIGTGDDIYSQYELSIPAINTTTNKTFHWIWNLTNATGTYEITSSPHTQEINIMTFHLCNHTTDSPQLIFNTFSTTEPTTPLLATFASAWDMQDNSGGNVMLNKSYEDTTEGNSTWAFCIEPNNTAYTVSVDITVDATGYTQTSHYIVDTDVSTVGENISLYLLNESQATLTQIIVRDQDNQPVQNAYTHIQRYNQGTDTYYGIGMTKSDNTGSDLAYLLWYTQWYNFVVVVDGEVVLIEGPKKISSTPLILRVGEVSGSSYEKFRNIVYDLSYNNATKNFVLTFTHTSGEVSSACLRTIKRNLTNDYTICHTCESSNSATIYCNIGGWGNGTFISSFYATGSPAYWIDELYVSEGAGDTLYEMIGNDNGTGIAIIFAGIIFSLFLISPGMGIFGAILGMLGSVVLGFQPLDPMALSGIIIVGVAMMWAVQK